MNISEIVNNQETGYIKKLRQIKAYGIFRLAREPLSEDELQALAGWFVSLPYNKRLEILSEMTAHGHNCLAKDATGFLKKVLYKLIKVS
jgi:hypothetical protein